MWLNEGYFGDGLYQAETGGDGLLREQPQE